MEKVEQTYKLPEGWTEVEIKDISLKLNYGAIVAILFLGISLLSCKKNNEVIPVSYFKNIIELTSDYQIIKVSNYSGEKLQYIKQFSYSDDLVEMVQTDSMHNVSLRITYYLNPIGLADSSIDSSYLNQEVKYIHLNKYYYDENRYKIASDYFSKNISDNFWHLPAIHLSYNIVNGNVSSLKVNDDYYASYSYSTLDNKIDIVSFLGDFSGKKNANLKAAVHFQYHGSPSTAPPSSDYSYILNSNGLVTECKEFYTSSYHTTDSEPSHEWRITSYEYIFQ